MVYLVLVIKIVLKVFAYLQLYDVEFWHHGKKKLTNFSNNNYKHYWHFGKPQKTISFFVLFLKYSDCSIHLWFMLT